jgi:hypothetical protein
VNLELTGGAYSPQERRAGGASDFGRMDVRSRRLGNRVDDEGDVEGRVGSGYFGGDAIPQNRALGA